MSSSTPAANTNSNPSAATPHHLRPIGAGGAGAGAGGGYRGGGRGGAAGAGTGGFGGARGAYGGRGGGPGGYNHHHHGHGAGGAGAGGHHHHNNQHHAAQGQANASLGGVNAAGGPGQGQGARVSPLPSPSAGASSAAQAGAPQQQQNAFSPSPAQQQPQAGGAAPTAAQAQAQVEITPSSVSDETHVIQGPNGGRILCVADVRGNISSLNQLAAEHRAQAILHTGDFGFYEHSSLERISDRTLKHLVQYSTLISPTIRSQLLATPTAAGAGSTGVTSSALRAAVQKHSATSGSPLLSEFPLYLSGERRLDVPVYTVWGACEDVSVLEKFRTGEYRVPNLHVLDEATTRAIEVGGVKLRLLGLGGAVVLHKLFDNGLGNATIAGGQGTMWTTILQIGELVDTAQKVFDPTETRVLITHASPGREGLLAQLALALKADLTISAGLHFRYSVSWNEFSVQHDADHFRNKLLASQKSFAEVWQTVKTQVEGVIDDNQRILLQNALAVTNRLPPPSSQPQAAAGAAAAEEAAWKNMWNWNLSDAAYGSLILDVKDGRVGAETKNQGFNFAYRRHPVGPAPASTPSAANATIQPQQVQQQATPSAATPVASPFAPRNNAATPSGPAHLQPVQNPTGRPTARDLWEAPKAGQRMSDFAPPSQPGGHRANGAAAAAAPSFRSGSGGPVFGTQQQQPQLSQAQSFRQTQNQNQQAGPAQGAAGRKELNAKAGKEPLAASPITTNKRDLRKNGNATDGSRSDAEALASGAESTRSNAKQKPAQQAEREKKQEKAAPAAAQSSAEAAASAPAAAPAPPKKWTLCLSELHDVIPVTEREVKTFFGDAAAGITDVKLTYSSPPRKAPTVGKESGASAGEQTEGEEKEKEKEKEQEPAEKKPEAEGAAEATEKTGEQDETKEKKEEKEKTGAKGRAKVQKPTVYIVFVDEAAMQLGLKKAGSTFHSTNGECVPKLEIAPDQPPKRPQHGKDSGAEKSNDEGSTPRSTSFGGRGGRGGRGGKNRRGGGGGGGGAAAAGKE